MKKKVLVLLTAAVFMAFTAGAFAAKKADTSDAGSTKVYDTGMMVAQLGVGVGNFALNFTLPIIGSFEYDYRFAPKVPLSFGATVGYMGTQYKVADWSIDYSVLLIGVRCSYHFIDLFTVPNADIYAGIMLGYDIVSVKTTGTIVNYATTPSFFDFGVFAGIRYYFTPMIGVYAEVGYAFGYANGGVVFKF